MRRPLDRLYHTTSLHYLPSIVACEALLPAVDLAPSGIMPRSSVAKRDRKLGLNIYVHLSPRFLTPLLRDKLAKGYAHAVIAFDAAQVLALPTAALLPYNPKSWRHREDFRPIDEPSARDAMLLEYSRGRFPSLEVVVKGAVPLTMATALIVRNSENEADIVSVVNAIEGVLRLPIVVDAMAFGTAGPPHEPSRDATKAYFDQCRHERRLLPPPMIPFD